MKKLLLLILTIAPVYVISQTPVPAGTVSGTWDLAGSPYMVNGEIYIDNPDTLQIEAGVEVRFTGWYKFIVNGSLLAEGTDVDQILFTADDTNNRWHGIRFQNTTGTCVLDYCIVEYGQTMLGGSGPDPDYLGGGVLCYGSAAASISIKNSIIRNNIADIGGGIEIVGSAPVIENCEITGNTAQWGGGIDAMAMWSSKATIKNCTIAYNDANMSGGGISAGIQCDLILQGNVIKHNTSNNGAGLRIYDPNELIATRNTIVHNHAANNGGGIGTWNALAIGTFKDNTIAYNHAASDGGGVFVAMNCSPSFESDILYFNTSGSSGNNQIHLDGSGGAPFFNYCDVQDSCDGFSGMGAPYFSYSTRFLNCIDADPLFADATNDDFNLTWSNYPEPDNTRSPCIDCGKPGMCYEPDGTCNDIGAFFFFQQLDVPVADTAEWISPGSYLARWSSAYGALGYQLDVALDPDFNDMVHNSILIEGDTSYVIENVQANNYYRVRAFNDALTSDNSNTIEVICVSIDEIVDDDLNIYASASGLYIHYEGKYTSGRVIVYNMAGKLLVDQGLSPGSNMINPVVSDQVVILRVLIDEKMYCRKLFVR